MITLITTYYLLHRELLGKKDIKFHDNGRLLSYRNPKAYVFERDLSVGSENDTFTTVNLPILVRIKCTLIET